ncbi:MAG: hypothetical protein WCY82_05420, partial [Desulfotomaculaceae bacterium]
YHPLCHIIPHPAAVTVQFVIHFGRHFPQNDRPGNKPGQNGSGDLYFGGVMGLLAALGLAVVLKMDDARQTG